MKLKLDENGQVVVIDGKPVYVYDDGKEIPFDAEQATRKIAELNNESKTHRLAKEKAEADLKKFEGINDVDAAKKALETVKNLDDKKLIDAGEAEKVKAEVVKNYEAKLAEKDAEITKAQQQLHQEVIGGAFARSTFIADKMAIPVDLVQSFFGKHFTFENGKIIAKDNLGNPIFSRKNAGEMADFDEAMEFIVSAYPQKDHILKPTGNQGGGSGSGATGADFKNPWAKNHWNMTKQAEIFKASPDKAKQLASQMGVII
ncbi:hypothetical protein FW755_12435 [Lonepinella koalarum]|uniref:DUF6651 domain-containing protein n=1 Tax=Lonepinella koalarum TaxID=53417 RepID=UPI0011E3BBB3|nr:DUF6651 domain-containing protein [Lonepinella koalarum]TYG33327.1 hypothetical protein FW755_12435 [Lonepinella koalarum]